MCVWPAGLDESKVMMRCIMAGGVCSGLPMSAELGGKRKTEMRHFLLDHRLKVE